MVGIDLLLIIIYISNISIKIDYVGSTNLLLTDDKKSGHYDLCTRLFSKDIR